MTFNLDLGVKVTRNVAQYPLHHVTYSDTKFEVATSNGLEGDTFTRNVTRWTDFGTKLIYTFFLKKKQVRLDSSRCVNFSFLTIAYLSVYLSA